jgi:hypothetical protein
MGPYATRVYIWIGEFYATTTAAYVDLSYNDLHEIEGGIRGMTSLHTLILAGN